MRASTAPQDALDLAVHKAGDMAPEVAVQPHDAVVEALLAVPAEGKCGVLDEHIAQHQELGQHRHDQNDGGQGAPAQSGAMEPMMASVEISPMRNPATVMMVPEVRMVGKLWLSASTTASFRSL